MTEFKAEVFQNAYLPQGSKEVNAIMTVTATGGTGALPGASPANRAKILGIICDVSGSMEGEKIHAAKAAIIRMISLLPPDTYFFVIAGEQQAHIIMPVSKATPDNRERATAAVRGIRAEGGTYISTWLDAALQQFGHTPDAIRQAVLLTDGANDASDIHRLETSLKTCEGRFQCECRGVGADWVVAQLKNIAGRLLGTTDIISKPSEIDADFGAILQHALNKEVSDVALRLWTPVGAQVKFCKEVSPEIVDLTTRGKLIKAQVTDYPTGAWGGNESRDFHFCIEVKPGNVGDEMLAGRASLLVTQGGVESKAVEARILAVWTDDESKSTKIDRTVAHYTGQAELAQSIQEGLEAQSRGDNDVATALLGKAVKLAHDSGNDATAKLLRKVVEVEDAETGTVRLKKQVEKEDAMALETRSTKTRRLGQQE